MMNEFLNRPMTLKTLLHLAIVNHGLPEVLDRLVDLTGEQSLINGYGSLETVVKPLEDARNEALNGSTKRWE